MTVICFNHLIKHDRKGSDGSCAFPAPSQIPSKRLNDRCETAPGILLTPYLPSVTRSISGVSSVASAPAVSEPHREAGRVTLRNPELCWIRFCPCSGFQTSFSLRQLSFPDPPPQHKHQASSSTPARGAEASPHMSARVNK